MDIRRSRACAAARVLFSAALLALGTGVALQIQHAGAHAGQELTLLHGLRALGLAWPAAVLAVLTGDAVARRHCDGPFSGGAGWVAATAAVYAAMCVAAAQAHGWLFGAQEQASSFLAHAAEEPITVLAVGWMLLAFLTAVRPDAVPRPRSAHATATSQDWEPVTGSAPASAAPRTVGDVAKPFGVVAVEHAELVPRLSAKNWPA